MAAGSARRRFCGSFTSPTIGSPPLTRISRGLALERAPRSSTVPPVRRPSSDPNAASASRRYRPPRGDSTWPPGIRAAPSRMVPAPPSYSGRRAADRTGQSVAVERFGQVSLPTRRGRSRKAVMRPVTDTTGGAGRSARTRSAKAKPSMPAPRSISATGTSTLKPPSTGCHTSFARRGRDHRQAAVLQHHGRGRPHERVVLDRQHAKAATVGHESTGTTSDTRSTTDMPARAGVADPRGRRDGRGGVRAAFSPM